MNDSTIKWLLIITETLRLITSAACSLNYLQSLRLEIIYKLYEQRGKSCGHKTYHAVFLFMTLLYFGATYAILYYRGFIYYTMI